jgi:DNA helicase-2/ATP-dependent DNA helicase PcrA
MSEFKVKPSTIVTPETSKTLIKDEEFNSSFFRMLESKGVKLNGQQISVVTSQAQYCLIDSVPGSGKTTCLATTAAYLSLVEGVNDNSIVLVTFTKKAAMEMRERIGWLMPEHQLQIYTIHSLCYKILTNNGFRKHTIIDELHQRAIVRSILKERGLKDLLQPESIIAINSYHLNTKTEIKDPEIASIINSYVQYKEDHKYLDFTDLLEQAFVLISSNIRLREMLQSRFKYILVDEYQDLNLLQYELIKFLCKVNTVLYAFGDRNQSIFSFNGSSNNIFEIFKKDFLDVVELTLDVNYRSTDSICGLASAIINKTMYTTKTGIAPRLIRPEDSIHEARSIVGEIQKAVSCGIRKYDDFCILYRSGAVIGSLVTELLLNEIPFLSSAPVNLLYENKMVSSLINHLKLAINSSDIDAFLDIAGTMYLSKVKTAHYLNKHNIGCQLNLFELMLNHPGLEQYQYEILSRRMDLMKQMADITPVMALDSLLSDKVIERYLKGCNGSTVVADELLEDVIGQLITAANQFSTIEAFLLHVDEVFSRNKEQEQNGSEVDAVNLMTIHGSKGLQWPVVFIIHCVEGILPHRHVLDAGTELSAGYRNSANLGGSIEEERRLLYIGITRAKDELFISVPKNHNNRATEISRFLKEVKL